jgi:hypothetical protein
MNPLTKRQAVLDMLKQTGIWPSNYAPPGVKLLWALGFDCPVPHMASFGGVVLVAGLYGIALGVAMAFILGFFGRFDPTPQLTGILLSASATAGAMFGVWMATYYAYGRRKHKLPLWKDFHPNLKQE